MRFKFSRQALAVVAVSAFVGTLPPADYQHIHNPACNADRVPMNVYAFRFHAEFRFTKVMAS